ncbi:hypothetical protein [Maricaulis parjimensis]|uniref:hypothetical protein n=1 Tax=Maricaulis parjimensis TaxID=144023 RepID=UPI00193A56E9|nr:hypothetical protein [Maricaulis parjimensis]
MFTRFAPVTGLAATLLLCPGALGQSAPDAQERIDAALAALGAVAEPAGPLWLQADISGEAWMLEQSGTLEGGWIRLDQSAEIILDLASASGDVRQSRNIPAWSSTPYGQWHVRFGPDGAAMQGRNQAGESVWGPARSSQTRDAQRYLDLFPQTLLREAAAAPDLALTDTGGITYTRERSGQTESVRLDWTEGSPLPAGFTIRARYLDDLFLYGWEENELSGQYGFWWRTEAGRLLPRQLDIAFNGMPWQRYELTDFRFEAPDTDIALPEAGQDGPVVRSIDDFPFARSLETVAPGVRLYSGAWNVAVIERADDVIVLDAPISTGYGQAVLAQIETDFPDKPVAGVITTSNAWPHMAGLRAYAERGIPILAHPDNIQLIDRMMPEIRTQTSLHALSDGEVLGAGEDAVIARFAPGPALDRMLFVAAPGHGVVWASDAVQLAGEAGRPQDHARQYHAEFLAATCADLTPQTLTLAMHIAPIPAEALVGAFADDAEPPCRL